jgi:hypothetical protein
MMALEQQLGSPVQLPAIDASDILGRK